ncbi:RHS repeat-associated core domain-containing protein [Reichenbachiella sp.]|uniref:RHS repeat-associated core domain-containing protein n=2 Tax=Reichenbachiella sp. TaxID=2184521 RepID=UPI003299A436
MANFKTYSNQYAYDKGINLVQRNALLSKGYRIVPAQTSNRAISEQLYASLNLTPTQKASLDQALLERGIFDRHGNQLKAGTNQTLAWDYRNMLQTTVTDLSEGGKLKEDNTCAKAGQRNCKVTEKTDALDSTTEINESMYMGNLEYRTTWHGENLSYDGETVTEHSTGAMVSPYEQYTTLRIRQGHKQAAQKKIYTYKDGIKVTERAATYTLDNNIDSCELTLNSSGQVESYESYKPYGDIAISFGKTSQQPYKYSGQEKDQSGLYYYGFRSLDPEIFRWTSPDPTGLQGSGLNWYVLVGQNPLTRRDRNGLGPFPFKRLFGDFAKQMLKSSFIGIGGIGLNHVNDRKRGLQKNDEQNLAFGTITTDYYVGILNVETDSNYYKTQTIDEKIELVTGAISAFNKKVVDDRSVRNSNNISR